MIISGKCTSLNELSHTTFITLTSPDGKEIRILQRNGEPVPFRFGEEYVIEINPVTASNSHDCGHGGILDCMDGINCPLKNYKEDFA